MIPKSAKTTNYAILYFVLFCIVSLCLKIEFWMNEQMNEWGFSSFQKNTRSFFLFFFFVFCLSIDKTMELTVQVFKCTLSFLNHNSWDVITLALIGRADFTTRSPLHAVPSLKAVKIISCCIRTESVEIPVSHLHLKSAL